MYIYIYIDFNKVQVVGSLHFYSYAQGNKKGKKSDGKLSVLVSWEGHGQVQCRG